MTRSVWFFCWTVVPVLGAGWTNPFENYARQNGSLSQQSGVKIQKIYMKTPFFPGGEGVTLKKSGENSQKLIFWKKNLDWKKKRI